MVDRLPQEDRFGQAPDGSSVGGHIKFELKSFVGRALSPRRRTPKRSLLHVGSGANPQPEFENLDFYMTRFWKSPHVGHDLRYPLPYADGAFEGAFSEHTLEHLSPLHAARLILEIYRVLKPGAVFRVSVPDLEKYVRFYNGEPSHEEFGAYENGCEGVWTLTQRFGHTAVYDFTMMSRLLKDAGFKAIKQREFRQGQDERLLIDKQLRAWETLYVEGVK